MLNLVETIHEVSHHREKAATESGAHGTECENTVMLSNAGRRYLSGKTPIWWACLNPH